MTSCRLDTIAVARRVSAEVEYSRGREPGPRFASHEEVGFRFANHVDLAHRTGHRNDVAGFYRALRQFGSALPPWLDALREDDLLANTPDHGTASQTRISRPLGGLHGSRRRHWTIMGALIATATIAACTEDIEGGVACPILCPEQNVTVFDTVFEPIALDTSVGGFPTLGTETVLLLASIGDTLDSRPVVRFDSLTIYYAGQEPDTTVEVIDSQYVKLAVNRGLTKVTAPVTIDVFDVDTIIGDSATAANDTSVSAERLLFRADRRIGTITLDTNQIGDSIKVPLDSATLIAKIKNQQRLRLGFRIASTAPAVLVFTSQEGGNPPVVRYDPAPDDTAIKALTVLPRSKTPAQQAVLASDLTDYLHVFSAPSTPVGPYISVGSLPAQRILFRFAIPPAILDSANVLRATLLLTQAPVASVAPDSAFTIFPLLVTAGAQVTDPARSAFLVNPARTGFDSIRVAPSDSGVVEIEIVNALRAWGVVGATTAQRALVLASILESVGAAQALFFSSEAPPALRPRLRVSYSPIRNFGIP